MRRRRKGPRKRRPGAGRPPTYPPDVKVVHLRLSRQFLRALRLKGPRLHQALLKAIREAHPALPWPPPPSPCPACGAKAPKLVKGPWGDALLCRKCAAKRRRWLRARLRAGPEGMA